MGWVSGTSKVLSGGSEAVARCVREILEKYPEHHMSITIIKPKPFVEFSVPTVTIEWSGDTGTQNSSGEQQTT